MSAAVALLALRLWVGLNFAFAHGLGKVRDPQAFLDSPGVQRFPMHEVLGAFAMLSEFAGGLLLAIGLFTRAAAGVIALTMLGAAFVVHASDPWGRKEFALTYAVACLMLVVMGGGRFALDRRLAARRRRQSPW